MSIIFNESGQVTVIDEGEFWDCRCLFDELIKNHIQTNLFKRTLHPITNIGGSNVSLPASDVLARVNLKPVVAFNWIDSAVELNTSATTIVDLFTKGKPENKKRLNKIVASIRGVDEDFDKAKLLKPIISTAYTIPSETLGELKIKFNKGKQF